MHTRRPRRIARSGAEERWELGVHASECKVRREHTAHVEETRGHHITESRAVWRTRAAERTEVTQSDLGQTVVYNTM